MFGASDWVSAPNCSKSRLSMRTARPNVLRRGTNWPDRRLRSNTVNWSIQPTSPITGSMTMSPMNGEISHCSASRHTK